MSILKSLLQPCYAVILASVILFSQSIYAADRYNNSENSKSSIVSNAFPFYLKFSSALETTNCYYYILEAGVGYRLDRHRIDVKLGIYIFQDNFIQGNYYYNIIEGNKASIFVTGGLISVFKCCSCTGIELGVGTTINLSKKDRYLEYLDIECSTMANYRPFPIHIRIGSRLHF
ncbi:hypothetical protein [Orientia tsutsugamushi]|uniref:Putative ompA-like autotransporter n=1 Tax=Orientia tsutsugamushi (strain Boryong) TaxID=357244 RepID=A5CE22_ORITB|nr:hypothetical protein [Orientia tsutsugamushi]CAM80237.1 putative ompA-like autotransporter [Orientia tsutsugamushi str. Boryong]